MGSCSQIWNLFQDATVLSVMGSVPGTVRVELDCDYLRDRLEGPGDRFFLTLNECSRFTYNTVGSAVTDLIEITARRLWVSGADQHEGFCVVHCAEHAAGGGSGKLEVAAERITVTIDSGREISHSELEEIAEEYWSGIRAHHNPD